MDLVSWVINIYSDLWLTDWSRSTVKKKIEIKKDWFYFITSFSMIIIARYSYVHDLFIKVLLFA